MDQEDRLCVGHAFQDAQQAAIDSNQGTPFFHKELSYGRCLGVALLKWFGPYRGVLDEFNEQRRATVHASGGNMLTMRHFSILQAFRFQTPQVMTTTDNKLNAPCQLFFGLEEECCARFMDAEV